MSEEPCQCPDCQKFYREHDRLVREFPTLRQQQELNWAALQSFRTLAGKVLEDLQKQYGSKVNENGTKSSSLQSKPGDISEDELQESLGELENLSNDSSVCCTNINNKFRTEVMVLNKNKYLWDFDKLLETAEAKTKPRDSMAAIFLNFISLAILHI